MTHFKNMKFIKNTGVMSNLKERLGPIFKEIESYGTHYLHDNIDQFELNTKRVGSGYDLVSFDLYGFYVPSAQRIVKTEPILPVWALFITPNSHIKTTIINKDKAKILQAYSKMKGQL